MTSRLNTGHLRRTATTLAVACAEIEEYDQIVDALHKALKEKNARIEALEAEIASLKSDPNAPEHEGKE